MALSSLSHRAIDAAKKERSETPEKMTVYGFDISVDMLQKFKIVAQQSKENIGDLIRGWIEDYVDEKED